MACYPLEGKRGVVDLRKPGRVEEGKAVVRMYFMREKINKEKRK